MKKLLPVLLILCILWLSGCGMLKDLQSGMQAAAAHAEEFCSALAKDDLASAAGYLHPNAIGFQFYAENLVPHFERLLKK